MSGAKPTWVAQSLANPLIVAQQRRRLGGSAGHWARYAGVQDRGVAAAFDVEVAALLSEVPELEEDISAASNEAERKRAVEARNRLVHRLDQELHNGHRHTRESLEAMLTADRLADERQEAAGRRGGGRGGTGRQGRSKPRSRASQAAHRVRIPLLLLNTIIAVVVLVVPGVSLWRGTPPPVGDWRLIALTAFTVWAMSFVPGWLFVRFLDRRAGALWDEYVIHLHRLGLDDPANLPEPPKSSVYHEVWVEDGGWTRQWTRNIYREKFDAYYGRSVSGFGIDTERSVQPEALFPVFLCTSFLAVAWTAALYDPAQTFGSVANPSVWTALSFAFLGAYVFFLQTLLRRYFQTDLRAGAYVSGYIRIVAAMLVVVVVAAALPDNTPGNLLVAIAFVVGWFPNAGMQWLTRIVSRRLRSTVPSLEPAYPLNRLDGLNLWYESRLLEEGIEDLENLMTAKIVDVLLHTRVPVARLVDWIDQALLLLHLPPEPAVVDQKGVRHRTRMENAKSMGEAHERQVLRACGIRSATALVRALGQPEDEQREALLAHLEPTMSRAQVLTLRAVIAADRRLGAIYNWQSGDAAPRRPLPLTPLH